MNINEEWKNALSLNPKDKYKKIQEIANQVSATDFVNNIEAADIDLCINIINQAIKVDGYPQKYSKGLALLIAKKLAINGDDKAEVISKVSGSVSIESGVVSIGDPTLENSIILNDFDDKNLLEITNQAKRLYFSTGGDGTYDVQLRLIKAMEPVLAPSEYKLVAGSTETVILQIPSGKISVGDIHLTSEDISMDITSGNYKVCTYLFATKDFRSYYIVFIQTDLPAVNQSDRISRLE